MQTISQCHSLLSKISNVWEKRSQVKKKELNPALLLDASKPDFRIDLLPFKDHPAFLASSQETKDKILSCGCISSRLRILLTSCFFKFFSFMGSVM